MLTAFRGYFLTFAAAINVPAMALPTPEVKRGLHHDR